MADPNSPLDGADAGWLQRLVNALSLSKDGQHPPQITINTAPGGGASGQSESDLQAKNQELTKTVAELEEKNKDLREDIEKLKQQSTAVAESAEFKELLAEKQAIETRLNAELAEKQQQKEALERAEKAKLEAAQSAAITELISAGALKPQDIEQQQKLRDMMTSVESVELIKKLTLKDAGAQAENERKPRYDISMYGNDILTYTNLVNAMAGVQNKLINSN